MPFVRAKLTRAYLAERNEKHEEYQRRLNDFYGMCDGCMSSVERMNIDVHKVAYYACQHGYRQRPVSDESDDAHDDIVYSGMHSVIMQLSF